jgi:acetyl esterase/lipase
MAWSWAYLAVSAFGAVFVLNAFRPPRHGAFAVQSFFAGWYTAEMPVWHIVWQAAATVAFGFAGAFGYWPGWLGLGVAVASWAGLFGHAVIADRSHRVLSQAEAEVPLPPAAGLDVPRSGRDTMWRFPRLIWPLPRPTSIAEKTRNVDYWGDGRRSHRLDIIRRRHDPPTAAPVLVYIHGGAWIIGDKREQGYPMLYELARRGWIGVTINYRLSPRATWPDHIVDCKRALSWVREHIAEYGGDPSFIAVSGGSAGGHLAALLALSAGDPGFQPGFEEADCQVDACVPIYGQYDMTCHDGGDTVRQRGEMRMFERRIFKTTYTEHPEVFKAASPLYRLRADAPPFFVIHGANDTLIPVAEARAFAHQLGQVSQSPVLYAELPFTQHAFDVLPSVRSAHAVAAVVRFLEGARHHLISSEQVSMTTLSADGDAGPPT